MGIKRQRLEVGNVKTEVGKVVNSCRATSIMLTCLFEQPFGKHQVIRIVPVTLSSLAMFPVFTQQFTGLHLQCVEVVIWDLFLELYNPHFFSI